MPNRNIIVIGASAGGVEPLKLIAQNLPADLDAAVLVVLHVWPAGRSILPEILSNAGPLPAFHPNDRETLEHGRIYVAPPDRHLLVDNGAVRVVYGPKENRHRPAVDPLFRSAALAYGDRVIGVLLSGSMNDGTIGLMTIKDHGGLAVVQDPKEATHAGMPRSAVENVEVDHILPTAEIPSTLARLIKKLSVATLQARTPESLKNIEQKEDVMSKLEYPGPDLPGTPTLIACPACHGVLREIKHGSLVHFRCRVGHAYTPEALTEDLEEGVEQALWIALRTLDENAAFLRRMGGRARERRQVHAAAQYDGRADSQENAAKVIRGLLEKIAEMRVENSEEAS